jgi:hypothetical protein
MTTGLLYLKLLKVVMPKTQSHYSKSVVILNSRPVSQTVGYIRLRAFFSH